MSFVLQSSHKLCLSVCVLRFLLDPFCSDLTRTRNKKEPLLCLMAVYVYMFLKIDPTNAHVHLPQGQGTKHVHTCLYNTDEGRPCLESA